MQQTIDSFYCTRKGNLFDVLSMSDKQFIDSILYERLICFVEFIQQSGVIIIILHERLASLFCLMWHRIDSFHFILHDAEISSICFSQQTIHSFNSTLKRSSSSLQVLHIAQHQCLARGRYASFRYPMPTKHEIGVHQRSMRAMHVAEILQVPIAILRVQMIPLHSMVISVQPQMEPDH